MTPVWWFDLFNFTSQVAQGSKQRCHNSDRHQCAHHDPNSIAGFPNWCKRFAAWQHASIGQWTALQPLTSYFSFCFQHQYPPAATPPPISRYDLHTLANSFFLNVDSFFLLLLWTWYPQFQVWRAGLLEVSTRGSCEAASPKTRPRSPPAHSIPSTTNLMFFVVVLVRHFSLYHLCKEFMHKTHLLIAGGKSSWC